MINADSAVIAGNAVNGALARCCEPAPWKRHLYSHDQTKRVQLC